MAGEGDSVTEAARIELMSCLLWICYILLPSLITCSGFQGLNHDIYGPYMGVQFIMIDLQWLIDDWVMA